MKNEYLMAKIDVYCSLLPSDRVIGWDMKMMSHLNSNASFLNIWDHLIWQRSPNLTRSSKLAATPNCIHRYDISHDSLVSVAIYRCHIMKDPVLTAIWETLHCDQHCCVLHVRSPHDQLCPTHLRPHLHPHISAWHLRILNCAFYPSLQIC